MLDNNNNNKYIKNFKILYNNNKEVEDTLSIDNRGIYGADRQVREKR